MRALQGKYDENGCEIMDGRPVSVRLGAKPKNLTIAERVQQQVRRELSRMAQTDLQEGPLPSLNGDEDEDDDYGQSPHQVVDLPDGRELTRGEALLEQERLEFDRQLEVAKWSAAAKKRAVEPAGGTPAQAKPAEPQPASGGDEDEGGHEDTLPSD